MASNRFTLLDTTFRDGAQAMGDQVTSFDDALAALKALDALGCFEILEVGFAASSGPDFERIKAALELQLKAKVAAFGRTHMHDVAVIQKLRPQVAVLVGKSRHHDVVHVLNMKESDYLKLIERSIAELVAEGIEVVFDAEHCFDALVIGNATYALQVLHAAEEAGASTLALCDTNGSMTLLSAQSVLETVLADPSFGSKVGVHFHDDRGRAIALSELAYKMGVGHIQGTFGNFGERCGNADFATLIPNLVEDHAFRGVSVAALKCFPDTYRLVCAALNRSPNAKHPYVGQYAFSTEAGMHQQGLQRDSLNYLHVKPERYGNFAHIGLSSHSGRANLRGRATQVGVEIPFDRESDLVREFSRLVESGYDFSAEATFELWLARELGTYTYPFTFPEFEVTSRGIDDSIRTLADLLMKTDDGSKWYVGEGDGPVDALVHCIRDSVSQKFPTLAGIKLRGFRVASQDVTLRGSAATVQVHYRWSDGPREWRTMSAHDNLIYASFLAAYDGFIYPLFKGNY